MAMMSDLVLRESSRTDSMLRQEIGTIVTGNCGLSPFEGVDQGVQLIAERSQQRNGPGLVRLRFAFTVR